MIAFTNELPGRKVRLKDGSTALWFGGTDYLGMGHSECYRNYIQEGMTRFGTHYGSSRQGNLRIDTFEETENELAIYARAPACLTVSSGMLAGHLLHQEIKRLARKHAHDVQAHLPVHYHYAPGLHPTLWGPAYTPNHNSWASWAENTLKDINTSHESIHLIFTDTVRSPWVEAYDFEIFRTLSDNRQVWLIADDSHGLGLRGLDGKGAYEHLSQPFNGNLILLSSLNKALGIPAGAIWGPVTVMQELRHSPWFAGASPALPANLYALQQLLRQDYYPTALQKLRENILYFHTLFQPTTLFNHIPNYPVYCNSQIDLFKFLTQEGILGSCFSYPKASDPPALRLVLSAIHEKEDIEKLAVSCHAFEAGGIKL
ncbi:7-keto-8-aminopelargonate synthetase-like enzyme [Dyadobacter jejuensis]|uniref:7-keto-8-aminopelargonate synthetase-like enzyme n=1 Tax=Dyadobacter jejuensis TaxID=1082580 RepID=A0A316A700_9BACT|nr:pyridoxal phosphate-dependent aminotransferase family protein [Dyadobacter jejuensis]PWJ53219.1 7-keto-8-aminopelargonate synthetase-like enzyme [Dyadobacter jejuensis]